MAASESAGPAILIARLWLMVCSFDIPFPLVWVASFDTCEEKKNRAHHGGRMDDR